MCALEKRVQPQTVLGLPSSGYSLVCVLVGLARHVLKGLELNVSSLSSSLPLLSIKARPLDRGKLCASVVCASATEVVLTML